MLLAGGPGLAENIGGTDANIKGRNSVIHALVWFVGGKGGREGGGRGWELEHTVVVEKPFEQGR